MKKQRYFKLPDFNPKPFSITIELNAFVNPDQIPVLAKEIQALFIKQTITLADLDKWVGMKRDYAIISYDADMEKGVIVNING